MDYFNQQERGCKVFGDVSVCFTDPFFCVFRTMLCTESDIFQGKTPGLIQHVLTVLVFWSWVLLRHRLRAAFQNLRLFPWTSILLWALGHLLGSAARSSPTARAKTGCTAQVFTAQGGHTPRTMPQNPFFEPISLPSKLAN